MSNEHTPGPWSLSTEGNPSPLLTRITGSSQLICVTDSANARLIVAAPELDAYRQYIEGSLERIERGGWTPVCFDEFRESEECANYMTEEEA